MGKGKPEVFVNDLDKNLILPLSAAKKLVKKHHKIEPTIAQLDPKKKNKVGSAFGADVLYQLKIEGQWMGKYDSELPIRFFNGPKGIEGARHGIFNLYAAIIQIPSRPYIFAYPGRVVQFFGADIDPEAPEPLDVWIWLNEAENEWGDNRNHPDDPMRATFEMIPRKRIRKK